jgi:hypothetical protein
MVCHSPRWPSGVDLDDKDEEGPPTLRGLGPAVARGTPAVVASPLPAPIAHASAPMIAAPRHRRSLLRGAAFAISVATMFVLGWWQPSKHAPAIAPAAATSEPGRTIAHRPARILAPSAAPAPRPPVAKPARTHPAVPMPPPAAMTSAVASEYEPMEL